MTVDLARVRWRSRRGMRELDAVLRSFVDHEVAILPPDELARFEQILELPDPTLLSYLTARSVPEDPDIARLIDRIRASHRPQA